MRTTDGCAESFIRILGRCVEEDVLDLGAHCRRNGVKGKRGLVVDRVRGETRNGMRNLALPYEMSLVCLPKRSTRTSRYDKRIVRLTSSAAIVTVWFVTMTGMMFACIQMKWE